MKSLYSILVLGVMAFSSASFAEVYVESRAYRPDCAYYSSSVGDFAVYLNNLILAPQTRIRMVFGFHDRFQNRFWVGEQQSMMKPSGAGQWMGMIASIPVDARGSYYFDEIEFAFEILLPNGQRYWDNGGQSPRGYYYAPIPERTCGVVPAYLSMPVGVRLVN